MEPRDFASLDSRTPVLVGAAAVQQRLEPPAALEPLELMVAALLHAADDAGCRDLLARASSIRVPRGFWEYSDPGRLIAERLGAERVRTELAEIGVLQTTLFGRAVEAIASGEEEVVLVAGGEAKYRALRAQRAGVPAAMTVQTEVEPATTLRPGREIWSQLEADFGLIMPVNQYALMENALRHAEGLGIEEHRREVARLWAGFARVAAGNPDAWSREALSEDDIVGAGNRMLAFPYGKLHNSQWNVDQAAALIFCSAGVARAAGIAPEKWVFPLAVAESNHMLPLSERRDLHRSHGFHLAGRRALDMAGLSVEAIAHFELYSCFPIAVRMQQRELGVPADRAPTLTGGMAFAGGPLNNFVLQALARMVQTLRAEPTSAGLLTAVSGMLTKQGVSLWSARPPAEACRFADVSDEVEQATARVEVAGDVAGPATVATYTVVHDDGEPRRTVALCDLPDGRRTLAASDDAVVAVDATERELCGKTVIIERGRLKMAEVP